MPAETTASPGLLAQCFDAWSRYRDIVWYRTLAGLKSEARQNFLGYLWLLLEPAITTAIAYVVYSVIWNNGGTDRVVMLLLGTMTWQWFESAVTAGMTGIKGKLHVMLHFPLPKYIFPLVGVLTSTWKFLCMFLVVLVFCALAGHPPNGNFIYLPLVLGAQLTLIIGVAIPLAIAVTYFNDLLTIMNSLFRLMLFLSGVVFEANQVPPAARSYFYANPMAGLIESYRNIVQHNEPPIFAALGYAFAWGLVLMVIGLLWSRHIDGKILKHVKHHA